MEVCHDGFTGSWVVGQQESQRLAWQHFAIDGRDLVRQRLNLRRADGEIWVKEMGKPNAMGFGR